MELALIALGNMRVRRWWLNLHYLVTKAYFSVKLKYILTANIVLWTF